MSRLLAILILFSLFFGISIYGIRFLDNLKIGNSVSSTTTMPRPEELVELGLVYEQNSFVFKKTEGKKQGWSLQSLNGLQVVDDRANQNLLTHLVDILKTTTPQKSSGHQGNSKQLLVQLKTPKRTLQISKFNEVSIALLKERQPIDFRDRKIFTLDADDIEELKTTGPCGQLSLSRDGDRWKNHSLQASEEIDQFLGQMISLPYESIDESTPIGALPSAQIICQISVAKRHAQEPERVTLYSKLDSIWAVNSKLPALYKVSTLLPSVLKKLK